MLESFLENTKAVCERVGIPTPESNDELTESTPLGIDTSCPLRERLSLALTHMANDHRRLERVLHLWRRVYSRRVLSPPLRPRILYRLLASILEPRGAGEEADHHMPRNEWNRAMPHGDGRDGHHQAAGMSGIPIIHALPTIEQEMPSLVTGRQGPREEVQGGAARELYQEPSAMCLVPGSRMRSSAAARANHGRR